MFSLSVLVLLLSSAVLDISSCLRFATANFGTPLYFSCDQTLLCAGSVTSDGQSLWLTYAPESQTVETGMALFIQPLRMFDGSISTSFISTFNFEIHPKISQGVPDPGDGMAFVMVANQSWIGSPGRSLGIYNETSQQGTQTVAVEFDTFRNLGLISDLNNNHVGIDLQNATSKAARNVSEFEGLLLYSGDSLSAWVEYDGVAQKMEVRINKNSSRPADSFVEYSFNLSAVVAEFMYVGFSASNGAITELYNTYRIYNWTFQTFGLPELPSPAPAPWPNPESASSGPQHKTGLIVGSSVGSVLFFVVAIGLCLLYALRRDRAAVGFDRDVGEDGGPRFIGMPNCNFTYKQLSDATGGFSEDAKLGQGGFGSVYRGILPGAERNSMLIAVKKISNESHQGEREFMAEVSIISQLRHRNVVQLLGWSKEKGKLLLVYEYMANGSLDKALYGESQNIDKKKAAFTGPAIILSWPQRFNIVCGIAKALHYLHQEWRQQVIHRDVKSSNIMLDDQFNAMLGDFGLARLVDHHQKPATTLVAGTYGYMAPEILVTRKFTDKTDTFAFGAVTLEIACGRKVYDLRAESEQFILVDWVWDCLSQDNLMSVVDSKLEGKFEELQMETVLLTGLLCSHPDPIQRPSMQQVIQVLSGQITMPYVPASKPAPVYLSNLSHMRAISRSEEDVFLQWEQSLERPWVPSTSSSSQPSL